MAFEPFFFTLLDPIFWAIFDHIWGYIGPFLDHFWTRTEPSGGNFGPFLGPSGIPLGSLRNHVGIALASFWGRFGVILTPFWGLFWSFWGLFLDHFGPFLGHFTVILWFLVMFWEVDWKRKQNNAREGKNMQIFAKIHQKDEKKVQKQAFFRL